MIRAALALQGMQAIKQNPYILLLLRVFQEFDKVGTTHLAFARTIIKRFTSRIRLPILGNGLNRGTKGFERGCVHSQHLDGLL